LDQVAQNNSAFSAASFVTGAKNHDFSMLEGQISANFLRVETIRPLGVP